MSDKSKEVRTRAPNFTKTDQALLIDAMKPYNHIIESKQTDTIKQVDKHRAWTKVTEVFNSNAAGSPRSVENLINCYRNLKSKIKKHHSNAKMLLINPEQRGALIKAVEENGMDWDQVASTSSWNDPKLCKDGFEELKKEVKAKENIVKKNVMGTGGGPLQPEEKDDLSELRKIIEPQVDGMFTIYDSDSKLMAQYQETLPDISKAKPIEMDFLEITDAHVKELAVQKEEIILNTPNNTKTDFLRKRKEPALYRNETTSKKSNLNMIYKQLMEAKLEVSQLKKTILERDVVHKSNIQELELLELKKEHAFKEKIREKELELMELKIKNAIN